MEIGSYIEDVSLKVYNHSYLLAGFVMSIVRSLDENFDVYMEGDRKVSIKVDYVDMNMAYDYNNFSIKQCPPILMALLDVLCVVNSLRKTFLIINEDKLFGIKVLYAASFYAVLSIESIISYCQKTNICIPSPDKLIACTDRWKEKYMKNVLRKYCMHYDFPDNEWGKEPFSEEFEKNFDFDIDAIYVELKQEANIIGDELQAYLIKQEFVFRC